jgi:hypothetical protein
VCKVDVGAAADCHDAVELVRDALVRELSEANGRLVAARIVLCGQSRAHAALVREPERWRAQIEASALDVGDGMVWLEQVAFETRGAMDPARLSARSDAIGELVRTLTSLEHDPAQLRALCDGFAELRRKLPAVIGDGDDAIALDDPAFIASLLPDVRDLLLSRLLDGADVGTDE